MKTVKIYVDSADRVTLLFCFAESGERQGNVSAQKQYWKGPFLSKEEIGKLDLFKMLTYCTVLNVSFTGNNIIVQFLQDFIAIISSHFPID